MNQFWKMNRSVEFSPNEVFLYFYLLNECNAWGWRNPFEHPNEAIIPATGISEKTVIEVRNRLQQKGLITFESGKENAKSLVYYLSDESKTVSKEVSKEVSKRVSKAVNISNKIKDSETITLSRACVGESFPKDSFSDKSLKECYQELKFNQSRVETVAMNARSFGYDESTIGTFCKCLRQPFMEL